MHFVERKTKVSEIQVELARQCLDAQGRRHLQVRARGPHIVIADPRGAELARLTDVGHEAFGLAFPDAEGGWEPMLIIDTLEDIVTDVAEVFEPEGEFEGQLDESAAE
jgi:hypothetical protein